MCCVNESVFGFATEGRKLACSHLVRSLVHTKETMGGLLFAMSRWKSVFCCGSRSLHLASGGPFVELLGRRGSFWSSK